jgi:flagellar biosynthesis protein FlhB
MAEDKDSSAEKSQEPTQKRLDKASEDGDTVRSKELNTTAILLAGSGALLLFGGVLVNGLSGIMNHNFVLEREMIFDTGAMLRHLDASVMQGFRSLLPVFGVLLFAAIAGPILLGGWNFAMKAVAPKMSRMNPLSGLGRMFGPKALMELFKAVAKVGVVASIALIIMALNADRILAIRQEPTLAAMAHMLNILGWSVLAMSCAMIIITMVDIPFQIHQHKQKLRMTLQQVKDEMKDTDGRPEVKQRIRQLQYQMAQNRMLGEVGKADVIITNPEHYAVALRYDQAQEGAPVLLAKGADQIALKIREIGSLNNVPIVSSPALARAIYFNTELNEEIPGGLYMAVAQILAYVFQLRQFHARRGRRPSLPDDLEIPEDLRHD